MGWQDRQYARDDAYHGAYRRVYRGSGMGAYDVVTRIIIVNVIVHLLFSSQGAVGQAIGNWGLMQARAVWHGEIWRVLSATYLHANFAHIFVNMLMLYFFGPMLERRWGGRQFLWVYTLGGVAGNIVLAMAGRLEQFTGIGWETPGLGASGSVMTVMAAAAVLYPNTEVLVYFLFPVRLRSLVAVYAIFYVYNILYRGDNYGGDMCHLAGLLFGIWWAKTGGWAFAGGGAGQRVHVSVRDRVKSVFRRMFPVRPRQATLRDRVKQRRIDVETVDRILEKVYEKGIHNLSPDERRALSDATERLRVDQTRAKSVDQR